MGNYLLRLKSSTKAIVVFFVFNITATQISAARDFAVKYLMPQLIRHPKLSGIIPSLFGIALALHRPGAQKFLHDAFDRKPDIAAVDGARMGPVEVIQKP